MKLKILKTAAAGYIYSDGHAVIVHREHHPRVGEVEWVEVFEKIPAAVRFTGRIVFSHPDKDRRFRLAWDAREICASTPSTNHGSENTKKLGLNVGSFSLNFADGTDLYWITMPDVIHNGLTYQPDNRDTFDATWEAGCSRWCGHRINIIHRATVAAEPVAKAA